MVFFVDMYGAAGSEEISELRELGKRAVGLLVGIRDRSGKDYGQPEHDEAEIFSGEETEDADQDEDVVHRQDDRKGDYETTASMPAHMVASQESPPVSSELEHAKALLRHRLSAEDQSQRNSRVSEGEVEDDKVEEDGSDGEVEMSIEEHTRVVLDMIITIVGEVYGQRDLLEFRDVWDSEQ